ncbi:WD repeat domain-containing protein 83-like [Watersipora subatra]|uniref:WD repeat domain-containing protein 83-like n=1 Tax=Watersipora subatra TaxID=2589382 RepID=UPI00355C0F46
MERAAIINTDHGAVRSVRFNKDGNYMLTCGSDKTVKLWNPSRQLLIKSYKNIHGTEILDVTASHDNGRIATAGMDRKVFLTDVSSGKTIRKIRAHDDKVNAVKFNAESTMLFSASVDGTCKAWDLRSRSYEPIQTLNEAKDNVTSVCITDSQILTGSADCCVRRYDIRIGFMYSDFLGAPVSCASFTKDSQCTLAGLQGDAIRLIDNDTGKQLNEFSGHTSSDYKIECTMNSKDNYIYSGSENCSVFVWDLISGKVVTRLPHDYKVVHSLSFHPEEEKLLSASLGCVYVWAVPDVD